ncbi:MAG: hypothetical protein HYS57_01045, partial [Parcubacteria group bacterium]|nr:hypothetical protein [Parcubacteria group bacterium]
GGGAGAAWEAVRNPLHEYTHLDSRTGGKPASADAPLNIVWMVPAVSFFSHQRSFVVGGSILLLAVLLWLLYGRVNGNEHTSSRWLVLLGFLPFTHPHTFFAAIVFFGSVFFVKHVWGQRREVRDWLWWGAAAMAIALPQVLYLSRTGFLGEGAGKSFFKPWFGWMTCVHSRSWFFCDPNGVGVDTNPLFFWTKNFGVVFWGWLVVLVFLGLSGGGTKRMREWVVPSVALFLIPNLFLLQPWEFDNNKALFWWWTIALLLIFVVLREGEALVPRAAWAFIFGVLIFVGGFSGTVDVGARVRDAFFEARADSHFGFYGRPELEAARWINGNTAPNEAFLSSDGANNFVPMLSGRPIFLGFTGWLWTQGRNALVTERKALAQQFFVTKDPSALCDKGVRWLLWDPSLFNTYPQARWVGPRDLGEIKFSQDVFDGQRHIIKLKCSNLSN